MQSPQSRIADLEGALSEEQKAAQDEHEHAANLSRQLEQADSKAKALDIQVKQGEEEIKRLKESLPGECLYTLACVYFTTLATFA